jgi:hypothetical protein
MQKCGSCNGTIREDETICFQCDAPVPPRIAKVTIPERMLTVINILLAISAGMTVLALFVDFGPSFKMAGFATGLLGLVKSSALQMVEKRR